jgi:transposase-like protein
MARKYTTYSAEKKFRIALEATRNEKTVNQLASEYAVHACQVSEWKRQLMESGTELFRNKRKPENKECSENVDYLQQQVGKLTVELNWLKKKRGIA